MAADRCIILTALLCVTLLVVQLTSAGGGHHGHGHGHHGHGHHHGGGVDRAQCNQAQQLFNQWWPQSQLSSAFQTVCAQFGATQAWALLQNQLGVPVTGALDQTTFQALLNNANHALLAQQLLLSMG
ncbi:unnamed protein product [Adineta ricciae]|uniref:Uncharacterized protein n=1 Tax=Adineta ricciae TaxID=249248 RepID=A0A813WST3_ADIRI|nr:unnamed protein product [Adineta ricciae]